MKEYELTIETPAGDRSGETNWIWTRKTLPDFHAACAFILAFATANEGRALRIEEVTSDRVTEHAKA